MRYDLVEKYRRQIPSSMLVRSRKMEIVSQRRALAYLLRRAGLSYGEIGKVLMRDHSTIVHYLLIPMNDYELSILNMYKQKLGIQ